MKCAFFLFCCLVSINSTLAQTKSNLTGCWLPEKYIQAILLKDSVGNENSLFPVQGFDFSISNLNDFMASIDANWKAAPKGELILILSYASEINTISTEMIDNSRYLLPHFASYLNMKYVAHSIVDEYEASNTYLVKEANKLVLETVYGSDTSRIYFVNNINGYTFKDIPSALQYVEGMGK